jgi:hypothetical protein
MAILGAPDGLFRLTDSDQSVGSFITKEDVIDILDVQEDDLTGLPFRDVGEVVAVDERALHKAWYNGDIPNAPPRNNSSMDEILLTQLISNTLPDAEIEPQVRVGQFKMDLKVTYRGEAKFIEFDGPSHFSISRYGPPRHHPFRKKAIVEEKTGIEVVNWAYWIQRCASNVKVLFDSSVQGYGVLWSTNVHFGEFYFSDSAQIIERINQRFNCERPDGIGYFYGPKTEGRNNPEHPIVQKIANSEESVTRLLPQGFREKNLWLPEKLWNIT